MRNEVPVYSAINRALSDNKNLSQLKAALSNAPEAVYKNEAKKNEEALKELDKFAGSAIVATQHNIEEISQ